MAAHSVAVAKAALIAPFIRADPVSTSREKLAEFHVLLDRVLDRCFHGDIQDCRGWLTREGQSDSRVAAVVKYLSALSASFSVEHDPVSGQRSGQTSGRRKRLHILYLINDWLHHAHYHPDSFVSPETVREALKPRLVDLMSLAAACDLDKHKRLQSRLGILLDQWQQQKYYDNEFIASLRQATSDGGGTADKASHTGNVEGAADANDAFTLPAQHGEAGTAWHDLPAANMLPHITPNSAYPIDAELMKPIRFSSGPADSALVAVVQDLLRDAQIIYGEEEALPHGMELDYDELGQKVFRSTDEKEVVHGETYYGWSKAFCERMGKRLKQDLESDNNRLGRGRSVSHDRYSSSYSRSRSRDRSSSRRRPGFRRPRSLSSERHKRSRSNSAQSSKRARFRHRSRSQTSDRDRRQSYSPPPPAQNLLPNSGAEQWPYRTPGPPPLPPSLPMDRPYFANNFPTPPAIQHGGQWPGAHIPAGMPIPPPRPPNWQGPWPPPPPPPPQLGMQPVFPHPPPPPPGWAPPPGQRRW